MEQLTTLELEDPAQNSLNYLNKIVSLQSLKIKATVNWNFNPKVLMPLQNLRHLEIQGGHSIRDLLIKQWDSRIILPKLVTLKISSLFPHAGQFPSLENFWITNFGRRTFDMHSDKYGIKAFLQNYPNLKSFRVFGVNAENYPALSQYSVDLVKKTCPFIKEFFCMPGSYEVYLKRVRSSEEETEARKGNLFVNYEEAREYGQDLFVEQFHIYPESDIWTDYDPDS